MSHDHKFRNLKIHWTDPPLSQHSRRNSKMLHSYRLIIDDATEISRPVAPVELVDRMVHSANQGAQTLHAIRTTIGGGPPPPRPLSPKLEQDQQIPPPSAGMDISENGVNGSKVWSFFFASNWVFVDVPFLLCFSFPF